MADQIRVETRGIQDLRNWIIMEGQFGPCATELLECLMIIDELRASQPLQRSQTTLGLRAATLLRAPAPAAVPVAVSERPLLKKDPFNDALGRCWCGTNGFTDNRGDLPVEYPTSWELREPCPEDDSLLPANALPLPIPQPPQGEEVQP